MKSTEAHGHDLHDTLNQNPFVAQKINYKQTTLLFCASLCVMHKAISNLTARYNKSWTNLAKMKICTSWPILSWTVHRVQSLK